jgi:hypothetical protein
MVKSVIVKSVKIAANGSRICEAGDFLPKCICEPKYNTKPESLKRAEKPRLLPMCCVCPDASLERMEDKNKQASLNFF